MSFPFFPEYSTLRFARVSLGGIVYGSGAVGFSGPGRFAAAALFGAAARAAGCPVFFASGSGVVLVAISALGFPAFAVRFPGASPGCGVGLAAGFCLACGSPVSCSQ